ncbi:thylakoid lumenal 15.0 kDa protein 2, chloroplastic-like isoform X2 [Hordeum vulgare subsp. vulgare]|uniref:thylakoid lumenal 15.0 kDa protein 2, chloroplastic-like isoform X2 n=1 Tax=Hordeum vulgare subsp. vulgare TaxID=112509 RepID=UPI001D1A32EB|nr:thylakoid lumenal 15.0 kDa protein 2, chloroplastic-like isoform X2 [Hordeum vulgare subsp. vulgare]
MVWSHADHREGIHWCPAHQCHLCGAYPLAIRKRRYVSQPSKVDAGWHRPGHRHDMYLTVMTSSWKAAVSGALALTLSFSYFVGMANAKAGVNKPELLPKEFTTVIDVAGFLSSGQENRIRQEIEDLEKDTGYKLRVLAQNYPDKPGCHADALWTTIWT